MDKPKPRIAFSEVSVRYGALLAVKKISLTAQPGEIIGLLGHNGAGKTTLVNVACGAVTIDSGTILIDGEPVSAGANPRTMQKLGVHVVHQEPAIAVNLSVADNLLLGNSSARSRKQDLKMASAALAKVGLRVDLDTPTQALGLGGRQLLSIARGLLEDEPRVLFLDEPAASLGQEDANRLHDLVRELAREGVAIFYVSHRLRDIVEVCDRYVVLRDGQLIKDEPMQGLSARVLAESLTDSRASSSELRHRTSHDSAPIVLSSPVGIDVRRGEIVGLFGMAGAEQFRVLAQLFGMEAGSSFVWKGHPFAPRSPREAIAKGVHMVQADRERDSLLDNMNAKENIIIPWLGKTKGLEFPSRRNRTAERLYSQARQRFGIAGPSSEAPIGSFSGGNRQKHVLGRWIVPKTPELLLLAQPTQGIDEASKDEIASALRNLADSGVPILVASAESDEISRICDRAYVFIDGSCFPESAGDDFDERLMARLLAREALSGTYAEEGK